MEPTARVAWLRGHEVRGITLKTATSAADFLTGIEAYQGTGFAVDDEESHPGVMCFGAPVTDYTGHVVAALSLSGLKGAGLGFDSTDDHAEA